MLCSVRSELNDCAAAGKIFGLSPNSAARYSSLALQFGAIGTSTTAPAVQPRFGLPHLRGPPRRCSGELRPCQLIVSPGDTACPINQPMIKGKADTAPYRAKIQNRVAVARLPDERGGNRLGTCDRIRG